jgi:hypothetical protein
VGATDQVNCTRTEVWVCVRKRTAFSLDAALLEEERDFTPRVITPAFFSHQNQRIALVVQLPLGRRKCVGSLAID